MTGRRGERKRSVSVVGLSKNAIITDSKGEWERGHLYTILNNINKGSVSVSKKE